jgi:pilus assembly protein TadC
MTILAVIAAGSGIGLGVFLAFRAIHHRPIPLARALADLERPRPPVSDLNLAPATKERGTPQLGKAAIRFFEAAGLVDLGGLEHRLRPLAKPIEQHAFEKLAGGIAGLALPVVFTIVLAAGGIAVSPALTALGAVGLGFGGFIWPDLGLAERIERRRRDFRHSLSAYLDLVTIILAGGGGLETALQTAADLGDGWPFAEIRACLRKARLTNNTPWDVFDQLGEELGVGELRELAASAHLAGDQGARIRASLAAKADSMRTNQTAAIEAQAEAATEKMLLPVVTLVVGMILFIGFGVVQAISTPGTIP